MCCCVHNETDRIATRTLLTQRTGGCRSLHFAVLLRGRQPVGNVVTNGRNVSGSRAGPEWTRRIDEGEETSVHAEVRAAQRSRLPFSSKRSQRNMEKKGVGRADGVAVCRFSVDGKLLLSVPCFDCVCALYDAGIKFVVYSTADGKWNKASIARLRFSPYTETGVTMCHTRGRPLLIKKMQREG
jgi:hypothetical protein